MQAERESSETKRSKRNKPTSVSASTSELNNVESNKSSSKRSRQNSRIDSLTDQTRNEIASTSSEPPGKRVRTNVITQNDQIMMELSFETSDDNIDKVNDDDEIEIEMATNHENRDSLDSVLNLSTEMDQPKKRNKFDWHIELELDDLDKAIDYLEERGCVCYDFSDLKCGQKFYFRCKLIPKERKQWCAQRYTIFLPSNSLKVQILRNQFEHDHDALLKGKQRPISDEMLEFITGLFHCGTTKITEVINHINYAKSRNGLFKEEDTPKKRQIEYLLRKFRSAEAPKMINLGNLTQWCQENSKYPTDENEAFVIAHEISQNSDMNFRFILSTPLLLKQSLVSKTIAIDATYKLNWLEFPLMAYGTVDREKKFHPLAYACCSHEKTHDYHFIFESIKNAIKTHINEEFEPETLIADGADAIRNAFYKCFASALLVIMCFAHVLRNCNKRPFASKTNKGLIMDDIRKMQHAPNRATFIMMSTLFLEKWRQIEPDFVSYFKKEWLGAHTNWFEGAAVYTPSTNNALESHNAIIKRLITLRRRLPMNQFLVCMKKMTADISIQFSKSERVIANEPNVNQKLFEEAAVLGKNLKAFKAKQTPNSKVKVFVVPSSNCAEENANESYYKTLTKTTWKTFDEFVVHGFQQFYVVQFSDESWKSKSMCTCVAFFKQNICKHIVAVGVRLGMVIIPQTVNLVPLARNRRKPGRPKLTASALATQN